MSNVPQALIPNNFPLGDGSAITSILADIPLLCVGIMSIGIFTFLLVKRQVTILATYLFVSSFFAFTAGTLDLSQVLIRHHFNISSGNGLNSVAGLIIAREVLLAVSTGFIYLFLWTSVAQCSQEEAAARRQVLSTGTKSYPHSASWQRWGYVGIVLQWSSLLASVSIPLLQIVWRIISSQRQYGNLYVAESTLETAVSAIFVLKLLLNLYLAPIDTQRKVIQTYMAPITALIISAGLGVGNLVVFAFSETLLGRFLRGIEVYILILYSFITTVRISLSKPSIGPIHVTENVDLPLYRNPENLPNSPKSPGVAAGQSDFRIPGRDSALSTLSSWILPRRVPQLSPSTDQNIRIQDAIPSVKRSSSSDPSIESAVIRLEGKQSHTASPTTRNLTAPSIDVTDVDPKLEPPSLFPQDRPLTDQFLSYYTSDRNTVSPVLVKETTSSNADSPPSGLSGIANGRNQNLDLLTVQAPGTGRPGSDVTSFDELLRQQSELDQSIAALRLFSAQSIYDSDPTSRFSRQTQSFPNEQEVTVPSRNTLTASYVTSKPSSASAQSDFSLSVFPEPPTADLSPVSSDGITTARPVLSLASKLNPPAEIIPIHIPFIDVPSWSASPSQIGISPKFDSAGTLYDVTSFIGDLTSPKVGDIPSSGIQNVELSDLESEDGVTPTSTASALFSSRPLRLLNLSTTTLIPRPLASTTMSSSFEESRKSPRDNQEQRRVEQTLNRQPNLTLRPFLLGTSAPTIPSNFSRTMVPLASRKGWPSSSSVTTVAALNTQPTV